MLGDWALSTIFFNYTSSRSPIEYSFLIFIGSFPRLPKEYYQLLHQLEGLIRVVLDAYIHNKEDQLSGIPTVKLLCTREKLMLQSGRHTCVDKHRASICKCLEYQQ